MPVLWVHELLSMAQRSIKLFFFIKKIQYLRARTHCLRYTFLYGCHSYNVAFHATIRKPVELSMWEVPCIVTGEAPG